jgi:hypothetical protein
MLSKRGLSILLFLYAMMHSIWRASGESIVRISMARRSRIGLVCCTSDVATWINSFSEVSAAELGALVWAVGSLVGFFCSAAVHAAAAVWGSATALFTASAWCNLGVEVSVALAGVSSSVS